MKKLLFLLLTAVLCAAPLRAQVQFTDIAIPAGEDVLEVDMKGGIHYFRFTADRDGVLNFNVDHSGIVVYSTDVAGEESTMLPSGYGSDGKVFYTGVKQGDVCYFKTSLLLDPVSMKVYYDGDGSTETPITVSSSYADGATYKFDENVIVGNVAFYGATSGRGFVNGLAGQRFCVRNSGATVVVEGVGNHGCEYMTGGCVVVLGEVGANFAAGMSGGVAYVYDQFGTLAGRCNTELVNLEEPGERDLALVRALVEEHVRRTASPRGIKLLYQFDEVGARFVKVIPRDYERVLGLVAEAEAAGATRDAALEYAFDVVREG